MKQGLLSLHDRTGERKYLNEKERIRFLKEAKEQPLNIRLFCLLLFYTGARIAEVHNLTAKCLDTSNGSLIIETLKRRKKGIFREIPIPESLQKEFMQHVQANQLLPTDHLWSFSIRTASRQIKEVMNSANIFGVRSSAKGLRHGFAVNAVNKAPLTLVKKWLGHSKLETTEIYLNILGAEEREIAQKIWEMEGI
ncbi:MAG: site-specific integrase [Bacteroidota bacterium]